MSTSLQHVSDKMMKMDIDKLGAQSLGLSLIPAVPDKFLIKYDPPKICVVYHFKDHNAKDQYWRDIPLEMQSDSTANSVTDFLFKEHCYYFDKGLVQAKQVEKLVQMILDKNSEKRRRENMGKNTGPTSEVRPQTDASKSKVANRFQKDREKAEQLHGALDNPVGAKKPQLDPIKGAPKGKLEPIEHKKKDDDFDFLGLDEPGNKDAKKASDKKDKIDDDYDFDFDFEDVSKTNKKPTDDSSAKKEPEKPKEDKKDDKEKKDEDDEYIVIDGKRFREIQIEGEEDEFLMDDDGNIYDKEGQYIGTAKDGGEGDDDTEDDK